MMETTLQGHMRCAVAVLGRGRGEAPTFCSAPSFSTDYLLLRRTDDTMFPWRSGARPPQNFLARTATGAARYKPQLTIVSAIDVRCAAKGRTSKRFL